MNWLSLLFAGIFEVVWAIGLKYTEGFTKLVPSLITIAAMIMSFWFLSYSLKTLPLGTSYAIWTGIGTIGTVIFGVILLGEAASASKLFFILLILIGIGGLKIISPA